ncbi:uncharacterized protein LOC144620543 [Crassostrea virginica]
MATSTSCAQDVIACDLCDKPTQQFCNSCQANLSDNCEHSGQRCEVNCKECDTPVCVKCIGLGPHKGHDVEELTETYEKKLQEIKAETDRIKAKLIPECQEEDNEIGNEISQTKSKLVSNRDQKTELSIEIGDYRATLGQMSKPTLSADVCLSTSGTELMDQVRVIAIIRNGYTPLYGVVCVGEAEAWVFGSDRTISRFDIHGAVKNTVTITGRSHWPAAISINCFRTQSKIIRYQGQKINQEIENDILGNPIFNGSGYEALYMSENNNGDLCVSEVHARSVVGVDKTGRVRFRYTGTPAKRKNATSPISIVTDALSQIIVADIINDCLHILNENGQFLRCVEDYALVKPYGLSVDSEGRLWVGLRGENDWGEPCSYGEIIVIKYLQNK